MKQRQFRPLSEKCKPLVYRIRGVKHMGSRKNSSSFNGRGGGGGKGPAIKENRFFFDTF